MLITAHIGDEAYIASIVTACTLGFSPGDMDSGSTWMAGLGEL